MIENDRLRRFALVCTWAVRAPEGLFFCHRPRSHTGMDPDLENVIRQALGDARAAGKDHLSQTETAVRTVRQVRPDITASEALSAVNLARHK